MRHYKPALSGCMDGWMESDFITLHVYSQHKQVFRYNSYKLLSKQKDMKKSYKRRSYRLHVHCITSCKAIGGGGGAV